MARAVEGWRPSDEPARGRVGSAVLTNVQTLRAVAAFAVSFVHLDVLLRLLNVRPFGRGGVDIFFVISGYLMVHTTRRSPPRPLVFFTHRILRIVPIYWLLTSCVFVIAMGAPQILQATRADPLQLVKSLLFIPFVKSNGLTEPVMFVGWTLNYEMFFYALFALGLHFRRYDVGLAVTGAVLLGLVAWGEFGAPPGAITRFYTSSMMLEFGFGMVLAVVVPRLPERAPLGARIVAASVTLASLYWCLLYGERVTSVPHLFDVGVPAALVLAGALAMERWGWRVRSRTWIYLGDASYSIYLTHPFVAQASQKAARYAAPHGPASALWLVGTLLTIAIAGVVVHRLVELPMTRIVRRWLRLGRGREYAPAVLGSSR